MNNLNQYSEKNTSISRNEQKEHSPRNMIPPIILSQSPDTRDRSKDKYMYA